MAAAKARPKKVLILLSAKENSSKEIYNIEHRKCYTTKT
jgi:hypothetical protein